MKPIFFKLYLHTHIVKCFNMKFLAYILGYFIWFLSFLIPRNKRIWVFGSFRGAFNDNAKYLFIHVSSRQHVVDPVWISHNSATVRYIREKGFKAYSIFSFEGLYYALRGKYYFFNSYTSDICFFTSGRAVRINLWHGVGLKKIEFCIDKGPMYNRYVKKTFKEHFYYPQVYQRPDYFISSTKFQSVKFAQAFRIDEEKCLDVGYPRNDVLLMEEAERQSFIFSFESKELRALIQVLKKYEHVFLYMPTWRESQRNLFAEHLDLPRLDSVMKDQNSLLILKPHANTIINSKEIFACYSHLLLLDKQIDIYPLLPSTDILITDYSSILYDYLLMDNKKVILYLYDYSEYVNNRDFNYPFEENVAGEVAYTFDELLDIIKNNQYNVTAYPSIREKFWGDYTGQACRVITEKFLCLL